MNLKNPALLKTGRGVGFLDYWFFRTGRNGGYEECLDGKFVVKINTLDGSPNGILMSAYTFFPKTVKGFWGAVGDFEGSEDGRLYRVGLRGLASYVCEGDEHFNVNVEGLPDLLARDWKKYADEIVKL